MNNLNNNIFIRDARLIELSVSADQIKQDLAKLYINPLPQNKNELVSSIYTSFKEEISKFIKNAENLKSEFTPNSRPQKFIDKLIKPLTKANNLITRIQKVLDPQLEGASEKDLEQVDPREVPHLYQQIRCLIFSMPIGPHFDEEGMEGILEPRKIEILPRRKERLSGTPCALLMIAFTAAFLGFLSLLNGPGIRSHPH